MPTPQPSAERIQHALEDLESAHREVTALVAAFPQSRSEQDLAAEIYRDIDRALAKIRFLFTTLDGADPGIKSALECAWGECPLPADDP
jgi:hypothetical protein